MKPAIKISIEEQRKPDAPFASELSQLESEEDAMMDAMSPKGKFTSRGLDPLVKATNMLLPLFGQAGDYPKVPDTTKLPIDFVRILMMFAAAIDDAASKDVISDEMPVDPSTATDDTGLLFIAGKLTKLAKDKDFKKFLLEPAEEPAELPEPTKEEAGMSVEDEDALLMSRM